MLEFTGERFIPGEGGARIAYEHLHRYLFARRWAEDRVALDVAAGSGYGAALLAEHARFVTAVELSAEAVAWGTRRYGRTNLAFVRGDATRLPLAGASVDLAVAFEVLEHVARLDQEALVSEVARILRPSGVALFSTPDRSAYSDARAYRNPFHVAELYRDELALLLQARFARVELFVQQVRSGSFLTAGGGPQSGRAELLASIPARGRQESAPLYLVAVCSQGELGAPPGDSVYLDPTDFLFEELSVDLARLNDEIERLGRWGRGLEERLAEKERELGETFDRGQREIAHRDGTIRELAAHAEREIAGRDREIGARDGEIRRLQDEITRLEGELDIRARWARSLEAEVADRDRSLRGTMEELDRVAGELRRIRQVLAYRVLRRLGLF